MSFKIGTGTDAIDDGKDTRIRERRQHAVPDATVIIHRRSLAGQERQRLARPAIAGLKTPTRKRQAAALAA